jgi:ABC-type cobalamin/Fe3+-siderophores transport systems, ATPase components
MIRVDSLGFSYGEDRKVLERVAFDAGSGECIAVLGNNGAGKSTLIKCLNRILKPKGGTVLIDGEDISSLKQVEIARMVAYVAQRSSTDRLTVFDSVLLGRKPHIDFEPTDEDLSIVSSVLEKLGLDDLSLRYVDELSGGEAQKVMLARAIAQRPKVLLLDEPTSNLDLRNQYEVLDIILSIVKEKKVSAVIVMHDLNLALRYCDRFLFIKDRSIFAYGGIEVMDAETIGAVYGLSVSVETIHGVSMVVPAPKGYERVV